MRTPVSSHGPPRRAAAVFRTQIWSDFRHIGAVAPSSTSLAEALAATVLARSHRPRRILEVGAGTGAVTASLAAWLSPDDILVAVERNAVLATHLQQRVLTDPVFQRLEPGVIVRHAAIETVTDGPFDAVLCALPFNNFTGVEVRDHIHHLMDMLPPGGRLSFFEYLWVRRIRGLFSSSGERRRLREVECALAEALSAADGPSRIVWWNLPPAVVHTIRRPLAP